MEEDAPILEIEPARLPQIEKVYDYFVTTPGGLDVFAAKELRALRGVESLRIDRRRRQTRIHFRYDRSPSRLLGLRSVAGVFADLGQVEGVTVGRPGMLRIAEALSHIDITPAIALYDVLNGPQDTPGIRVTCTVGRGHRFTSGELQQVLLVVLAERYDLDPDEQSGPYNLHVSIDGRRARLGVRLGRPGTRDYVHASVGGELPPIVAAAMAQIDRPRRGESWIDPACRNGANLIEAGLIEEVRLIAMDTHDACIRAASINAGAAGLSLATSLWDGMCLPFRQASADCLVADLTRRNEFRDVSAMLLACREALKRSGRAVVVCDRDRDLEDRIKVGSFPYELVGRDPIHLRGLSPSIYHFRAST